MWITETDIKTYLRERYPREYRRMSKTGELERYAKSRKEQAEKYYQELMEQYSMEHENGDDFMENERNRKAAEAQARELVNEMIFN